MSSNTFIHDGVEVKKTGRTAERKIGSTRSPRVLTLVEVTPVDPDLDWKKWIAPEQLFIVQPDK